MNIQFALQALLATTALFLAPAMTTQAYAQGESPERCPPNCEVSIELPDDLTQPPSVSASSVAVKPGERLGFRPNGNVTIVFPEDTPFAEANGNLVYSFDVHGNNVRRLRIRTGVPGLCAPPGCKYDVIDSDNGQRPPLDPYIIIEP